MKTKPIIIDLLNYLEMYYDEKSGAEKEMNTTDFIGFINSRHSQHALKRDELRGGLNESMLSEFGDNSIATDVSILVSLMFRYAKMYIKKALKDSLIKTADEFSFIITLLTHESLTKKELIGMQVMEKTSGIEIINRLVKLGLIEQFDDSTDLRSKRLKITESGKAELYSVLPMMSLVSKIVVGNLSTDEQNQLTYLLRKLDHFHNDIYHNERNEPLEKIIRKTFE